jgi:3D (Asp-Asp-Asp) domain-containing protein
MSILPNSFGDNLPIIPSSSSVQDGKVLFTQTLKAHLIERASGKLVAGHALQFSSSQEGDKISATAATDADGDMTLTLETRDSGSRQITMSTPHVTLAAFAIDIGEAWYETGFEITHYTLASESDFSGKKVAGGGLPKGETHKEDFLYGARGIPMQGTGQTEDGKYIHYDGGGGGWHHNKAGHPDVLNDESSARFSETDNVHGHYGVLTAGTSIAVDPTVIPAHSTVEISSSDGSRSLSSRHADDTGGGIKGNHIDCYIGAGSDATSTWQSAGGDLSGARVKFVS